MGVDNLADSHKVFSYINNANINTRHLIIVTLLDIHKILNDI